MRYFQNFPKINYTLSEYGNSAIPEKVVRNIPNMTVKLQLDAFQNQSLRFETYRTKDRDRPDTVSAAMYGTTEYSWIVLLANNMRDWYDWPLNEQEFYNYMNKKYESSLGANDGLEQSNKKIASYKWTLTNNSVTQIIKLNESLGGVARATTGAVTVMAGSNTVSGIGTNFTTEMVGDILFAGNTQSTRSMFTSITNVVNSTSLQTATQFTETLVNDTYLVLTNLPENLEASEIVRETVYDKETEEMDKKREIKLIALESIPTVLAQFKTALAK